VIMVAPMRRRNGACCYFGHLRWTWYLIHGPPPPHRFAGCSSAVLFRPCNCVAIHAQMNFS
jgi:hypothetical protein